MDIYMHLYVYINLKVEPLLKSCNYPVEAERWICASSNKTIIGADQTYLNTHWLIVKLLIKI